MLCKFGLLLSDLDGERLSGVDSVVFKDFASEKDCDVAGSFKMSGSQGSIEYRASDSPRAGHELELELFIQLVLV